MSSESEKQFFAQREKPPEKPQVPSKVSPEKREKAIQYAEEIRRIREKEILTEEDLVKVKELAERIERIYSPEIKFESEKAKERLEVLKETPLWDEDREQWNKAMDKNQVLENSSRHSNIQLLGILVETITGNLEEAKKRLEELKKTKLWDEKRKQWNWYMDKDQVFGISLRDSNTQLLEVLVEVITGNLEEAKEKLEELKKTSLWDKEKKQWNWSMDEDQKLKSSSRSSNTQLFGVLAEAVTGNSEEAKKRLEELKETSLWDKEKKQWNYYMDENQVLESSLRDSDAQLLGVLVEAITGNLEGAEERLEELKKTPLWDKRRRQWSWYIDKNQKIKDSSRPSDAQLLGVLIEAFHEKGEEFVEWLIKEK